MVARLDMCVAEEIVLVFTATAALSEEEEDARDTLPSGTWCSTSGPRSGWKRA